MALSVGKRAVGIEIDKGAARVVELAGSPQSPKLTAMAAIALPEDAVDEGMIVDPSKVGEALKKLWEDGYVRERSVMLGVSNQGVLVRYASIPKVPPDKLDNVIKFHAQEHLPIPLNTVVLDYLVIGERIEEEQTMLEVLLVAARRDMLDGFIEALDLADLEPIDIDVSTLALMWVLPEAARSRSVAIVNVANGLSNILVAAQGSPRLARLVSVKLKDLADSYGAPMHETLMANARAGTEQQQMTVDWISRLGAEISSSVSYYQGQDNASYIEAIVLNGRGARLKGISAKLEEILGLPVRVTDPLAGINASPQIAGTGIEAVEFAISVGLARRGLEG